MSPRLAVGEVSIASEGSAPCPPGSTMSPPTDGGLPPPPPGGGAFAVAKGAANTAAPASTASSSKLLIEVVLPRGIHTTRSRRAPAERPGLLPPRTACKHGSFRLTSQSASRYVTFDGGSSAGAADQGHALAEREEHRLHAIVPEDVLVEPRYLPAVLAVRVEAEERVVGGDQAVRRELREDCLVIVDVASLVGVDEGEVERPLQRGQGFDAGTDPEVDPVRHAGLLGVPARDGGRVLVDVAGDEAPIRWHGAGHRDRRPAGEGSHLEHALRLRHRDEEGEERALDRADHHLRVLLGRPGLGAEAVEDLEPGA